jgi:hypothetical protein
MAIYPKIPVTQFYGNPCDHDTRNIRVEQGRGGVVDRGRRHFIQGVRKTYQVKAILKDRDELQTFLETNRGLPFEFRYDDANDPALFICKSHKWEWLVYASGNGVWSFSGNFEQVYRPGWVPVTTGAGNLTLSRIQLAGEGTITVTSVSPTGSGSLVVGAIALSGDGAVGGERTGSGDLQTSPVTMSGSGNVTLTVTGSGTLETSSVVLSGSGSLVLIGSGDLVTSAIVFSGSGTVGSSITGSGDLITSPIGLTGSGSEFPTFRRPGGVDVYFRPDGTSYYVRP